MKKFVAGKVDEIPSEIIRILTEKETFIRDLVMRYPQWFSQDMGQIMEKELEDVLEEFREIPELESMVSDRVDALARARDLLLDFHSIIAERENIKQSFSIDSLLELVNRRNLPIISENQLKMMKSNFDLIKRDVDLLNFEYENFGRLIKDLEGYIWRLEVQGILRNKNSTPVPSQLYKMLRSCPDMECSAELRKLGKKLKIIVMDIKEARKAVVGWLSGEFNLQESRRSLERALVSDLTASPDVEEQVKIANKVLNNENKLTDSTTQKLIDFGYTNTKLVQKFLGKETLKKLAELDKADSIGVFRDDNVEEMIEEKVVIQPSVSSSAITPEKSIEVPVEESSPILKDKTSESVENMDIEEPEQKEEEIMEQESLVVAEEPLEEQAVEPEESERMIEEPIQEEEPEIVVDHFAIEVDNMEEMVEFTEYIIPTPESIIEEQVEAISEKIVEDQHISDEEDLKEPEPESDNDEIADQEAHEEAENCHEPETHHAIPEPEAPKVDQSEQKTSSGKKAKPLISFDEAVIYFRDYKKPETYSGTQDQFNETMTYINWAINQFKQRIELSKFTRIMGKLSHVVAIEVPDMKELQTTEARAVKLRDLALQMPNDELIAKREQIEAEYRSVQEIEIIELDMMFSEMDRDWQTSKDLKEAKETIDKKTLDQMIILKNRVDAARYYISKVDKFKVYDLFTIVLVNAWKIHDHDYGKPEIDYNTLKEVLIVIEEDNKEKDRHINPMNAEFAKNLYTSVRTEYKRIIDSLTIGTDQSITAQQSYKQFVDFTSKLMEFKNKMTKEEKGKKDDTSKLAFVLKPTLNKNKLNLLIDYELSVAQIDLVKPAFINRTTQHHRKYFLTMIKTHLESNLVFKLTHEKAFKRAAAIERDLFDNNLTKPAQYEHIGMQYINFMKPIKEYKYISLRLMSRKFKYDYLTRQMHVGVDQMPKWEAEYKKQYLLGKEVKIKREDVPANVQKPAILKYDPEETINRMMQEPIEGQDYPAPAEDSSLKPKYLLSRNIDIKVRQSALVNLDYLSYRIFEGDFTFARDGEATKTFSNVNLILN